MHWFRGIYVSGLQTGNSQRRRQVVPASCCYSFSQKPAFPSFLGKGVEGCYILHSIFLSFFLRENTPPFPVSIFSERKKKMALQNHYHHQQLSSY